MLRELTKRISCVTLYLTTVVSTIVLYCSLACTAQALSFSQISQVYFFGDSLTDSGFNNLWDLSPLGPLPTGKAPTFTTFGGFTWAQYIAHDIKGFTLPQYPADTYPFPDPSDTITNNTTPLNGIGPVSATLRGVDFAAAGSTTNSTGVSATWAPSLHAQIQNFLSTAGSSLDPNAVFFIWSGANDFLALLAGPMPTEFQLLTTANNAAKNVANEVARLSQRGAKRIVVLSLPNIAITPLITSTGNYSLSVAMKTATFTFNSLLNQQLGKVISKYNVKILYADIYKFLDDVVLAIQEGKAIQIKGQTFLFTNYTQPACGNVPSAIYCQNGTPVDFVFADTVHPTDMAHRLLSLEIERMIENWK